MNKQTNTSPLFAIFYPVEDHSSDRLYLAKYDIKLSFMHTVERKSKVYTLPMELNLKAEFESYDRKDLKDLLRTEHFIETSKTTGKQKFKETNIAQAFYSMVLNVAKNEFEKKFVKLPCEITSIKEILAVRNGNVNVK